MSKIFITLMRDSSLLKIQTTVLGNHLSLVSLELGTKLF